MTSVPQALDPEIADGVALIELGDLSAELLPSLARLVHDADTRGPGADGSTGARGPGGDRAALPAGGAGRSRAVHRLHARRWLRDRLRELDDGVFARWCPELGVVGVSVEYRLAPETPYPGPLEDCYRALVWTHEHADELGVDRSRLGVGGHERRRWPGGGPRPPGP